MTFPLVDTTRSPFAKLKAADMNGVSWSDGFWGRRFRQMTEVTVPHVFDLAVGSNTGTAYTNLRIAAGLQQGEYRGNDWYDEWIHKWIEAASVVWSKTKDPKLEAQIDAWIDLVRQAQCEDGYLATQIQVTGRARYQNPAHHECYVMGHFLTAACVHFRATGKRTYLDSAIKCGRHLARRFMDHREEMRHFPLNPSLVMGAMELHRITGEPALVELATIIIDSRGAAGRDRKNPLALGDQNQDRVPLRKEDEVVGHSVFWSYLYAGATDLCLERGDRELLAALERLWADVVHKKMYITGGCSAVDLGTSMRDVRTLRGAELLDSSYFDRNPYWDRDPVHEAVGAAYELPNAAAYNETCGQIGLHMWSWRMLLATGEAKYAEVMERQMYNGFLSGIGLDGLSFSYSNALRCHGAEHVRRVQPVAERFPMAMECKTCCPTNLVRTLAEMHAYLYATAPGELWVHHYGAGSYHDENIRLRQETDYPWDGLVTLHVDAAPPGDFSLRLRIPEWAGGATIAINGVAAEDAGVPSTYHLVRRTWRRGDRVTLELPLRVRKLVSHPLVEETRRQVAVMRGPLVYCLEQADLPAGLRVDGVSLPAHATFTPAHVADPLGGYVALDGPAAYDAPNFRNILYLDIDTAIYPKTIALRLIPYFAWCNRGVGAMSVWLPIA